MSIESAPLIPESAWLLAQASVAASHKILRQFVSTLHIPPGQSQSSTVTEEKKATVLAIGPGRDGALSGSTGFLSAFQPEQSLTSAFQSWEEIVNRLPSLLRQGRVHAAVCRLPALLSELTGLEDRYLSRAAIVISSLLHGYVYEARNLSNESPTIPLPQDLTAAWDYVSSQLGRPQAVRMIADDMLNNIRRVPGLSVRLSTEYFGIQEERMSVGLQQVMEETFAPALEMMTDVHKSILACDDRAFVKGMGGIAERIIACGEVFSAVPFRHGADGFDPVFWGKTYPEIGRPLRPGGLTNSGVNSPLFHALDSFLGTIDPKDELHEQQIMRRSILPHPIRRFIEALEDPRYNVRSYAETRNSPSVTASVDAILQLYAWLLERHRFRAISAISIAHASGRQRTAGGARQNASVIPLDEMLNRQMQRAIDARLKGQSRTLTARVVSVSQTGSKTTSLAILLPCPLPVKAGDRIQIWPRNKVGPAEIVQIQRLVGDGIDVAQHPALQGSLLVPRDLRRLLTMTAEPGMTVEDVIEKLPMLPPRHYTITEVKKDMYGLAQHIALTIAHSEGLSAAFLRRSVPGQLLTTRLIPEPLFRLPADVQKPLLLIAQGAGVGPFLGYLSERKEQSHGNVADIILILSARYLDDVPYLERLTILTKQLPLTIHLSLSGSEGRTIQQGREVQWDNVKKVQETLIDLEASIKRIHDEAGHIYVCGSVAFGGSVRSTMHGIAPIDESRYHEDCFGGRATPASRREVSLAELAYHNQPGSLWMAIDGIVYDLTSFSDIHPGGLKTLIESAGTVADRRFYLIHSGDSSQGIIAQVAQYAIGPLYNGGLSPDRAHTLSQIVLSQNILNNNTCCAPGREMPFFIYADSLFVTRKDIEKVIQDVLSDNVPVRLLTELEKSFTDLKKASWWFLANALEMSVTDREKKVFSTYSAQWNEFHKLFEELKKVCCSDSTNDDNTNDFMTTFDTTLRASIVNMLESVQSGIRNLNHDRPEDRTAAAQA